MGPSISLKSVVKRYGARAALDGLDLEVAAGEWVAVLGPSGAGKTTLLRLVAGLEAPDEGRIEVGDGCVVGMVFQDLGLWPRLTAAEHLDETLRAVERDRGARAARVAELLREFEIGEAAARRPAELSIGQQQRLAVARALARRPSVLLLDEPFSSLDPLLRKSLAELLARRHAAERFTAIYVSHYLEAPVKYASRVAILREGKVEQVGALDELRSRPASAWVAEFLGVDGAGG